MRTTLKINETVQLRDLRCRSFAKGSSWEIRANWVGFEPVDIYLNIGVVLNGAVVESRVFYEKAYFAFSREHNVSLRPLYYHGSRPCQYLRVELISKPKGDKLVADQYTFDVIVTLDRHNPLPATVVGVIPLGVLAVILGLLLSRLVLLSLNYSRLHTKIY